MSGDRVNMALASLYNGVSQQAPTLRLTSQADEQVNGYSTVADGLRKRPPTRHVARLLDEAASGEYAVHFINRDEQERYVVLLGGTEAPYIKVFDLNTGLRVEVTYISDDPSMPFPYLEGSTDPSRDFALVTTADVTFIVNKTKTVAMVPASTAARTRYAYAYIKKGVVSTRYSVTVGGQTFSHTTDDPYTTATDTGTVTRSSQPDTIAIATALANAIRTGLTGYTVTTRGSVLRILRGDGNDFTFRVSDSWGDEAMVGFKDEVQKFTDLPAKCFPGTKVRIGGENPGAEDDYYVEYSETSEADGSAVAGVWREALGWNLATRLDSATMPHILYRTPSGKFMVGPASVDIYGFAWARRAVGDANSVPEPSFVGKTISDIFFYRNRLGVIADENVILSKNGEFFNFWPDTATTVLATDPIDVAVSDATVSILRHAVPFNESLLLFSDQTQFQLGSGGAAGLSPETVKIDPTTRFESSALCSPVGAGQSVFFPVDRGETSGLREYYVSSETTMNDAADITAHVPRYLPGGIFQLAASTNEDVLFALSRQRRNAVWVYKYQWVGDERVQSAWSRWEYGPEDQILGLETIHADLYLVIRRPDGIYLETADLRKDTPEPGFPYRIHLDRLSMLQGVYSAADNTTTWALPYALSDEAVVLLGPSFGKNAARVLTLLPVTNPWLRSAKGNFTAGGCYVGVPYTTRYRFSPQFVREGKEPGSAPLVGGRLQLLRFSLTHRDSGYYRAEVTARNRETLRFEHLGRIGNSNLVIGQPFTDSGTFRFPVRARNESVRIELVNDLQYPMNIQSAEWEGTFRLDARRV